jgi:hypothetical protein
MDIVIYKLILFYILEIITLQQRLKLKNIVIIRLWKHYF